MSNVEKIASLLLLSALLAGGCNQAEPPEPAAGEPETPGRAGPTGQAQAPAPAESVVPGDPPSGRIQPGDLVYEGAFRLPGESGGSSWEYSGYAMTCFPDGDPDGPDDGYPGSLFAVGHDHHQLVSEISIPVPVVSASKKLDELNTAATLQEFSDIRGGLFGELEIPRAGLEYLPPQGRQTTAKLHFCWGQHFQFEREPSHGWCELDLSSPETAGLWHVGQYANYVTNDYLFEIPAAWAAANTPGLRLATGRFRDGRWGGLGPALLACGPWIEGNPPAPGATLRKVTPLLLYGLPVDGSAELSVSDDMIMSTFQEADEWSGGAWLTGGDKSAVVLVGTKAIGKCWYGFANGVVYPTSGDPDEEIPEIPPWPFDDRGWWSEAISAQMIFFDPDDLAAVARGTRETWEPQPYAELRFDAFLFDPGFDHQRQKRYLLGAVAFDRARGILYVMERRVDEEKSVVHVFKIQRGSPGRHSPGVPS